MFFLPFMHHPAPATGPAQIFLKIFLSKCLISYFFLVMRHHVSQAYVTILTERRNKPPCNFTLLVTVILRLVLPVFIQLCCLCANVK